MKIENTYSKIQQGLSYLLIFSLLFLNSFQIPFFQKLQAEAATDLEIVSILVHEGVYNRGELRSRIERYAEDIQQFLNNTKAIIYVIKSDASPEKIAALNEKLYFE